MSGETGTLVEIYLYSKSNLHLPLIFSIGFWLFFSANTGFFRDKGHQGTAAPDCFGTHFPEKAGISSAFRLKFGQSGCILLR